MSTIEQIEKAVLSLSEADLKEFRAWFSALEDANWDAKIKADADHGRLDQLADEAVQDHDAGRTTPR